MGSFAIFVVTVVFGVLGLIAGLRLLRVIPSGKPSEGTDLVRRAELERIEDALTALDGRFDRLLEQQRFLERLLAGREEGTALPPGEEQEGRESPGEPDSILFDSGEVE